MNVPVSGEWSIPFPPGPPLFAPDPELFLLSMRSRILPERFFFAFFCFVLSKKFLYFFFFVVDFPLWYTVKILINN